MLHACEVNRKLVQMDVRENSVKYDRKGYDERFQRQLLVNISEAIRRYHEVKVNRVNYDLVSPELLGIKVKTVDRERGVNIERKN